MLLIGLKNRKVEESEKRENKWRILEYGQKSESTEIIFKIVKVLYKVAEGPYLVDKETGIHNIVHNAYLEKSLLFDFNCLPLTPCFCGALQSGPGIWSQFSESFDFNYGRVAANESSRG